MTKLEYLYILKSVFQWASSFALNEYMFINVHACFLLMYMKFYYEHVSLSEVLSVCLCVYLFVCDCVCRLTKRPSVVWLKGQDQVP